MKMCYHPWVGLDISPRGDFKPCCKYNTVISNNLKGYFESPDLEKLKRDFLKGEQPAGCSRCWQDESAGLPSKRTLDNKFIFNNTAPELDQIKSLSLPFGNVCNLACRICDSYSSSKWFTEASKLKSNLPDIKIHAPTNFHKSHEFMQSIKELSNNVLKVDIPGGEPFYADQDIHYDFLKHLVDNDASQTVLHYTTNCTKLPNTSLGELWKEFREVDIQLSLDGIGEYFEYSRWPTKWSDVLDNVKYFQNLESTTRNIKLSISHTVSIFTMMQLPDFIKWTQAQGLPEPYFGLLSRPLFYSITALPFSAKQAIRDRFLSENIPELEPIINAMFASDDSQQLDKLMQYVKIIDIQRQQSFISTFPELYQLLGESCQTLYQQY